MARHADTYRAARRNAGTGIRLNPINYQPTTYYNAENYAATRRQRVKAWLAAKAQAATALIAQAA